MTQLRTARLITGLRQFDLAASTRIPLNKIGAAERGAAALSDTEERIIWTYLRNRARRMGASKEILSAIFRVHDADEELMAQAADTVN
jgi:cytoskeletal protein RodZ